MREVQLYIGGKKLDLFKGEEIVVSSTIQNFQDLSKVFTDFSQTFTVPTSKTNNAIFSHFYNNDVDGTFRANTRVEARIEINNIPFRKGKIQLEGSSLKDNQSDNYKITFYGDVVTLKDLFGEDKLRDLDYIGLNSKYIGTEVESIVKSSTRLDVMYPLITSNRVWSYGDATANDISVNTNAISYTELFPALSDSKILELIESKYNVSFDGNFLTNKRFLSSYTWWKNRETASAISEPLDLEFNLGDTSCIAGFPVNAVGISNVNISYIDVNTLTTPLDWQSWYYGNNRHIVRFSIFNTSSPVEYYIDVYKNGVYSSTVTGNGNHVYPVVLDYNDVGVLDNYTFKMRSSGALTFDFTMGYIFEAKYKTVSNTQAVHTLQCNHTTLSNTISIYQDFSSTAPDQKVADWFSGLLKQFNLTCYPLENELTFQIETLEDWYRFGGKHDITEYVDVKDIKVDRAKLYNEINFKWETSKSLINEAYSEFHNKNYGELSEVFPDYDGGKYEIKLPFETLLFSKFTGVNLQVAYCLTKAPDYKPYIPKPVKLYLGDNKTGISFYLNNGTSNVEVTNHMMFGAETEHNGIDYTINFGEELSTMSLLPLSDSLYNTYYKPYLVNLFNPKTRIVTVTCILPLGLLTKLSLDDSITIRDKKYRINDMKTNLTTGHVTLVLISDWSRRSRVSIPITPIKGDGGTIVVPVKPVKGGWIAVTLPVEPSFIISNPTLPATITSQVNQLITIPSNGTGIDRQNTIVYTCYYPDGSIAWVEEVVFNQLGSSGFLLHEDGGYIYLEDLTGRILL